MFEMQHVVITLRQTELSPLKIKINCFTSMRCGDVHRKQIIFCKRRQDFLSASGKKHQRKRRMGCSTTGLNHT